MSFTDTEEMLIVLFAKYEYGRNTMKQLKHIGG